MLKKRNLTCNAGQLKDDDYSKEIRKFIKNNKGIITTGL